MITNRNQCSSVPRANQVRGEGKHQHHIKQHDIEIRLISIKGIAEDGQVFRHGTGRTTGKPVGTGKEVLNNKLRSEGCNRQIEPFNATCRDTDQNTDQHRHDSGEWDSKEHRHSKGIVQPGRGKSTETEEGRVTERYLSGETNHQVESKCCNTIVANLDQQIEHVRATE